MATIARFRIWWVSERGEQVAPWEKPPKEMADHPSFFQGLQSGRNIIEYQFGKACWLEIEWEKGLADMVVEIQDIVLAQRAR